MFGFISDIPFVGWETLAVVAVVPAALLVARLLRARGRKRKRTAGKDAPDYWKKNRVRSKESCEIAVLIHQEVNLERETRGLARLAYDHHLAYIARGHSRYMAKHNHLGHTGSGGETPTDRAKRKGYKCDVGHYAGVAENCYQLRSQVQDSHGNKQNKSLQRLANEAVRGWMASPGHRANILNPHCYLEGIGFARSPNRRSKVYITQNFYG